MYLLVDGVVPTIDALPQILGKAHSAEQCPTLMERTGEAEIDDVSHYTVSPVGDGSLELRGIRHRHRRT